MKRLLESAAAITLVSVVCGGCGGSGSSSGNSGAPAPSPTGGSTTAPVVSEVTVSKTNISVNDPATLEAKVVLSGTGPVSYNWRQVSGPTANIPDPTASSITISVPPNTTAGQMVFEVAVSQDGQTATQQQSLNYVGDTATFEHQITFRVKDDPIPTAGDSISTVLSRVDGATVSASKSYRVEYTMKFNAANSTRSLPAHRDPIRTDIKSPDFNGFSDLGQDAAVPTGQFIDVSDLESITATLREVDTSGNETLILENARLSLTVGGTGSATFAIP